MVFDQHDHSYCDRLHRQSRHEHGRNTSEGDHSYQVDGCFQYHLDSCRFLRCSADSDRRLRPFAAHSSFRRRPAGASRQSASSSGKPAQAGCLGNSFEAGHTGQRWVFQSWNDGSPAVFSFTAAAGTTPVKYAVTFAEQDLLSLTVTPSKGGSVTVQPSSSSGFYPKGAKVTLTATPSQGYT